VGTYLLLQLQKGSIQARSDNLSVITIIKEQLTSEATNRKITLDISSEVNNESTFHTLKLLHPMIQEQYEVAKKHQLIDALKELQMNEQDLSFLSLEYK